MEVSGQFHALVISIPKRKSPASIGCEADWVPRILVIKFYYLQLYHESFCPRKRISKVLRKGLSVYITYASKPLNEIQVVIKSQNCDGKNNSQRVSLRVVWRECRYQT
jgi:hypothetical protein